ncbi:tigger transposable element-derived protein 1 [Trichonephila clavipes]|nr:tigger transposable element-derived protein 1 [Trichonephila clavipes]
MCHWMQEGTTDRRGRSHPPQCTTTREDRQIVRMAVTDRSVTSQTVAQPIESVTHHSVSAHTIRRRLQQSGLSARRPLLGLLLTQNHGRLRRQWCDERRMWVAEWNQFVFTDESRICLHHHEGRIRVWRHRGERMLNSCVVHRHTGPAPGIMGLATAIFQHYNARLNVACIVQSFFVNHQIELLPWPARSRDLSPIENMWSMVAQRLTQITPPAATPDQLWQCVEAAWSAVPQEHFQSEVASADEEAARKYPEKLAKIIKDGEYCAHQVFNADETGLFWKKMPTRTYIAKSEKTASGFKAAKDRVTLLLCSNASGDRMLKPLLVNRSLKPRALKKEKT